jgi:hypothetical protein
MPLKPINLEPNWPAMFDLAVTQVETVVDKNDMRDFIVEMLEFGKRLYNQNIKE